MAKRQRTNRQLAEMADVPLRVFERVKFVIENGIPELFAALENEQIKAGPAERIAKLPKDRQLAELEAHLNKGPVKKTPRTVMDDMRRIGELLDSLAENWTEEDCKVAACVLSGFADGVRNKSNL